jgi:VanZ like family
MTMRQQTLRNPPPDLYFASILQASQQRPSSTARPQPRAAGMPRASRIAGSRSDGSSRCGARIGGRRATGKPHIVIPAAKSTIMQTDSLLCRQLPSDDRPVKIELARYRTLFRVFLAMWLAGVVCGSLASGNEMSSLDKVLPFLQYDKLMHFGAYAGLAFLSMLAFERRRGMALALSMILLGVAIELAQHFSPGRTPDFADAIANSLGVLSGLAFGVLLFSNGLPRRRAGPETTPAKMESDKWLGREKK